MDHINDALKLIAMSLEILKDWHNLDIDKLSEAIKHLESSVDKLATGGSP